MDFELQLFDRIEKIKSLNKKYDLENNSYIAFSGGKDSTCLHYLIDLALPNNKIPRVFNNTGIEFIELVKYVKDLASKDNRIIINNANVNIKNMLNKYGYPFKSKQHAHNLSIYQNSGMTLTIKKYLGVEGDKSIKYQCPNILRYQFTPDFKIKCSDKCCYKLKKEPMGKWAKEHNKTITLTGMRASEGGYRNNLTCITNDGKKIHILAPLNDEFIEWFINKYHIELCKLYYPPFNFKRTGCVGCPFALNLQNELDMLKMFLPNEYKRANLIWKTIYDEYKRLNYRLNDIKQLSIFDL